ncbi:MAG TPA: sugar phosphate isomerase/epimerase [Candidatus Latescibacteria bacterium]|nr:sugar phosphate isomerase/epimerase [Candidatus Latescibacterota bacterium]
MKVGVFLASLRLDTREALKEVGKMGADGVQLMVVGGDLDPDNLSRSGREDLVRFISTLGLEISALCGDLGGEGYRDPSDIEWRIDRTKQIFDLSLDLKTAIVTTHIGVIPEDENDRAWKTMQEALEELGSYAETRELCLAAETGPEEPGLMRRFLGTIKNEGIRINYDPANLVMRGFDPLAGVDTLKDYIVHTHAKDGLDPEKGSEEVPLGKGDVPLDEYIKALREIGYEGYLTIERETGEDPVGDVRRAIRFLRDLIG